MKNMLDKYAERYAWPFKFWKFFLLKSLKELNVQESTFPGVFRRQLDLLKKLIEIFTALFWGLISLSNTYVNIEQSG